MKVSAACMVLDRMAELGLPNSVAAPEA